MRLVPGPLNTTQHETAIADFEASESVRCRADRGVWERDSGYRQVDPSKEPSPAIASRQGTTGFGFGSYGTDERFLLAEGDALFISHISNADTSAKLLERESDGDTTLMTDLGLHTGTDAHAGFTSIFQHRDRLYAANPEIVRRFKIDSNVVGFEGDILTKNYDPSLYEDYFTLADNYVERTLSVTGTDPAPSVTGGSPGAPATTVTAHDDGTVELTDDGTGWGPIYQVTAGQASVKTIPSGSRFVAIPVTKMTPESIFPSYSGADASGIKNRNPKINGAARTPAAEYIDFTLSVPGTAATVESSWFLLAGDTMWLVATATPGDYDGIVVSFPASYSGGELGLLIGNMYVMGEPMRRRANAFGGYDYDIDHAEDPAAWGALAGMGPDWARDDVIYYAFRGSDAAETEFGDPTFVQVRCRDLYLRDWFQEKESYELRVRRNPLRKEETTWTIGAFGVNPVTTGDSDPSRYLADPEADEREIRVVYAMGGPCPMMPQQVTLQTTAVLKKSDGVTDWDRVQFLRRDSATNTWYRLGLQNNTSGITQSDNYAEVSGQLLSLPFYDDLFDDRTAPNVDAVTCGCEWKGHLVFGDEQGRIYFSDQVDETEFIWRDYTEGGTLLGVDTQPRSLDVSGNREKILAVHGLDSLIVLTRRRAYFMSGPNAIGASGPYQIEGLKGTLGHCASAPVAGGLLVASDDGLYYLAVNPNGLGRAGDVALQNLTLGKLKDSWDWLIGSHTERTALAVAAADGHLWAFRGSRFLHRRPSGNWCSGEWATGMEAKAAATDGLGRIAVAFSDNSVGYLSDEFPTDGGVAADGDDGTEFEWSWQSKKFVADVVLKRATVIQMGDAEPMAAKATLYSEKNPDGYIVNLENRLTNVDVSQAGKGNGGGWFKAGLTGGAHDRVVRFEVEGAKGTDGRGRD
jgi:hypothetical protein